MKLNKRILIDYVRIIELMVDDYFEFRGLLRRWSKTPRRGRQLPWNSREEEVEEEEKEAELEEEEEQNCLQS